MFARFCEFVYDKWKYLMWYLGFAPMEAYFVSMKEYLPPVKTKLNKKDYLTGGKKLRDAIYFIAKEDNPNNWAEHSVLCVRPDYDRLHRGDYVILYDEQDKIRIAQVKASGYPSMPDIFDGNELVGITHDIVGKVVGKL